MNHFDVIIVGAGLSGIGAARQLQDTCPNKSFAILEGRERIGGTWDLFRYPGIRSDSDMYTMGYDSKPWLDPKAIADGPSILSYVIEAAEERGLVEQIHFGHWVKACSWSSADATWTIETATQDGGVDQYTCNVLFMCSGYYNYEAGYTPEFPGIENFSGDVVHPQKWPESLDYANKKVVIIGSGATAMTLVPAMSASANKVTMLQRSPTYVVSMPAEDAVAKFLNRILPEKLAYRLIRWKNVQFQRYFYGQTRKNPDKVKKKILTLLRKQLDPGFDVDKHFTPTYNPWDQRMCLVPDADLFKAIRSGKADVVTDHIDHIAQDRIVLKSGETLEADVIVTATGLNLELLGGAEFRVDGAPVDFSETYSYKGMMFSGVPNLVYTIGYINASWTLRSELVAEFLCRLVNHLHETGTSQCTPRLRDSDQNMPKRMMIDDFTPGYMQRSMHLFPRQGDRDPWRNTQNYTLDKQIIRHAPLEDGALQFTSQTAVSAPDRTTEAVAETKSAA